MADNNTTEIGILRSNLLLAEGFEHAFSTRLGGLSEGPYAGLNLGRTVGDNDQHVRENEVRFRSQLKASEQSFFEVSQVHGSEVATVDSTSDALAMRSLAADALIAESASHWVGVRTADCVPVLLADRRTRKVAAVHAGWRGIVAEIVAKTISKMGSSESDLIAVIGPHLRVLHFEIGPEVAEQLAAIDPGAVVRLGSSLHGDMTFALRSQLQSIGVPTIDLMPGCTFGNAKHFYSHRRDQGVTGRMMSAIRVGK